MIKYRPLPTRHGAVTELTIIGPQRNGCARATISLNSFVTNVIDGYSNYEGVLLR